MTFLRRLFERRRYVPDQDPLTEEERAAMEQRRAEQERRLDYLRAIADVQDRRAE